MNIHSIMSEIEAEYHRAAAKFPAFNSAHEGYAILKEELDELWEAVRMQQKIIKLYNQYHEPEWGLNQKRIDALRREAIQVAAMALRFVYDLPNFKN